MSRYVHATVDTSEWVEASHAHISTSCDSPTGSAECRVRPRPASASPYSHRPVEAATAAREIRERYPQVARPAARPKSPPKLYDLGLDLPGRAMATPVTLCVELHEFSSPKGDGVDDEQSPQTADRGRDGSWGSWQTRFGVAGNQGPRDARRCANHQQIALLRLGSRGVTSRRRT